MSSSKFVGQLKQNNIQINNLRNDYTKTEKHMIDHEQALTEKVNDFMEQQNFELKQHTENNNNPHQVTKTQVGLSRVINEQQATKTEFDKHVDDKSNPHSVTKVQVGLGKVDDIQQAPKTEFDNHVNDLSNPHYVTKEQIGLGNVTNDKQASFSQFQVHDSDSIRHVSQADKDKWNGSQLYKITQDNGLAKYLSGADFNTVTDTGFYYISSASTALNAPVNNNGYLMVYNYGTYAYQEFTSYSSSDTSSSGRRKFMRNKVASSDTWTTWREIESAEGSQSKVDAHANNADIHVTQSDKDKWNGAQISKISSDDGQPIINITTDFHKALLNLTSFTYFSFTGSPPNAPNSSGRGFWTGNSGKTVGHIIVFSNDNKTYRKSYNNGVWSSWERLLTDAELSGTWNAVTLINGAQQNTTYPFKFSVVSNVLWLRGTFGSLPAIGTVVAKFTNKPTQLVDLVVPTIGSYGTARFGFTTDGDLRFDGIQATDTASVSRVSFNIGIPLW
ncbi:pyocin knob domain-containing protein [Bacillus atrophaeus]|uniref:pyocin knob domain-containing protein n=1 Tax=Bacillus atrophaeus TaxID=1452 RepID=UPI00227F9B67|nr:pyocin knob domain-containing protein [Bacillus atrophaeus]MCY8934331.1 pyocin knob domain-containing protein [Bacillus atrophaeus]